MVLNEASTGFVGADKDVSLRCGNYGAGWEACLPTIQVGTRLRVVSVYSIVRWLGVYARSDGLECTLWNGSGGLEHAVFNIRHCKEQKLVRSVIHSNCIISPHSVEIIVIYPSGYPLIDAAGSAEACIPYQDPSTGCAGYKCSTKTAIAKCTEESLSVGVGRFTGA